MAATWKVKETATTMSPSYSGDLQEALNKAKKDRERYINDKDIEKWTWLKRIAEAKIEANTAAIRRANCFIEAAENELKSREATE